MKLVSEVGSSFALRDNSMVFGNVVWLVNEDDKNLYHLIDEKGNEIIHNVDDYVVYD